MKPTLKIFILRFLITGGIYALIMATFDWAENEKPDIGKFIFNFVFFGLIMTTINWWMDRRYSKKTIKKDQDAGNE